MHLLLTCLPDVLDASHVIPEGSQGLQVAVVDQAVEVGLLGCFLVFMAWQNSSGISLTLALKDKYSGHVLVVHILSAGEPDLHYPLHHGVDPLVQVHLAVLKAKLVSLMNS